MSPQVKSKKSRITTKIVLPKAEQAHPRYFFRSTYDGLHENSSVQTALIVDDDKAVRKAIKYVLERRLKLKVYLAANGAEGIRQARDHHFDLIISDVNMPIMDGIAFFDWLDKNQHEVLERFIFITGGNDMDTDVHAFRDGKVKVLDKPFALNDFLKDCNEILTA